MPKLTLTPDTGTGRNSCIIQAGVFGTVLVGFGPEVPERTTDMRDWAIYHLIEALAYERQRYTGPLPAVEVYSESLGSRYARAADAMLAELRAEKGESSHD